MTVKIYAVGGCVRDVLLGRTPKDYDYVVVGATPEYMIENGYVRVGASFPVFLKDGNEYALARTERKVGVGYNGFETEHDASVTLEQDLIRRDLTVNSMAQDLQTGEIIDPFGGREDLSSGVLRHTSEAFAEDPVRVLRTARFAARYGFDVSVPTLDLMKKVMHEIDAVPAERVWAEFEKGLAEGESWRMIKTLIEIGAFTAGIDRLSMFHADYVAVKALRFMDPTASVAAKMVVLTRGVKMSVELAEHNRLPSSVSQAINLFDRWNYHIGTFELMSSHGRVALLTATRSVSTLSEAFIDALAAVDALDRYDYAGSRLEALTSTQFACSTVDCERISIETQDKKTVASKIFNARVKAVIV